MAYDTTQLVLVTESPIVGAGQQWRYSSVDAKATVSGGGYISDGGAKGLKVGDQVIHYDTNLAVLNSFLVIAVIAVSIGVLGAANLSVGVQIS